MLEGFSEGKKAHYLMLSASWHLRKVALPLTKVKEHEAEAVGMHKWIKIIGWLMQR
jgi:hypothetical protein